MNTYMCIQCLRQGTTQEALGLQSEDQRGRAAWNRSPQRWDLMCPVRSPQRPSTALEKQMAPEVHGCSTSAGSCPSSYMEGEAQEQTLPRRLQNGSLSAPSFGTGQV